uniref:protein-tyrosine-phosphatase n=1 Tax=Amphimedon queenslandica TaxID=400682 RepID=A0A1X7SQU1_AMPQE
MAAESEPWFHPNLSGFEAEELLKRTVNGRFLFRPSQSNPRDCTLSIKTEGGVTHVRIKKNETGYHLFPDEVFPNLNSFVHHYMEAPLRLKDETLVHLLSPVLHNNEGHLPRDGEVKDHLNLEQDFEELPSYLYSQDKGNKIQNIHKNRYNASIPFDDNVISLKEPSVYGSTYINASPIKTASTGGLQAQYIATQGPLDTTISDFWRLVWQEQSSIIIMLTELVEL